LLGAKHYLTAEALGFRGMVHALQKNNKQAFEDFSTALPILIERNSGGTFSYDRKMRLRIISESYLELLSKVRATDLEKDAGIDAIAAGFKLADVLSGSTVRGAISASTARAASTSEDMADLSMSGPFHRRVRPFFRLYPLAAKGFHKLSPSCAKLWTPNRPLWETFLNLIFSKPMRFTADC
jgi:hypothetical protein